MQVLAGHGLTYRNVRAIADIPQIVELNIGHNIIARAALVGLDRAVRDMLDVLSLSIVPYLGILTAAAVEGEVVYVSAVVMASLGRLNPVGVLISGSIGGWAGDQFWFYAARGRLSSWLNKFEGLARRRRAIQKRIQRHATKLILAVRFLPGLRIAIPLACAYAGISAISVLRTELHQRARMGKRDHVGDQSVGPDVARSRLGIKAWWAPVIPAVIVVVFFRWLSRTGPKDEPSPE